VPFAPSNRLISLESLGLNPILSAMLFKINKLLGVLRLIMARSQGLFHLWNE
jgi:hypothetical protein